MASLLNIGLTGLNAAQAGLATTSHNIANASTPGFSRQAIVQTTQQPQFSSAGYFGQGTRVETVKRIYSDFLTQQVLSADTRRSEFDTYAQQMSAIDNLLADPNVGLSPAIQDFFKAIQDTSANPANIPARQSMITTAESLISRFHSLDLRLNEIRNGVESEIEATVGEVNSYAQQIADVNQRIALTRLNGVDQAANDLLDQRDQLINELNQLVRVTTLPESDGSLSVFIGSGQPLVIGTHASQFEATPSTTDPQRLGVSLVAPGGTRVAIPEGLLDGGKLGGLLAFRRDSLDSAQNQLGLVALGLAESFNAQHRLGQDLNGNLGGDFFAAPEPFVFPEGAVTVDITSVASLTVSDYSLTNEGGGNFTLTRLSDGQVLVNNAALPASVDGLAITVGTLAAGETAMIQPTRHAAGDIALAGALSRDPRLIAAAAPVLGAAAITNGGTGELSAITINTTTGLPLASPVTLTFDSATNTFLVNGATPATLSFNPATQSNGATFTLGTTVDLSFTFTGTPMNGDSFTLDATTGGVSDNRNAVLLGNLQLAKTMLGGTASYQSTYSQLVSDVGNKTREVQVNRDAQASLLTQASTLRDSVSSVNLDEEAANLIRYQQAYQAAAKVMAIASNLFDEVLALGR